MIIRCRCCYKVYDDKSEIILLLEGTCKRCVAAGQEDRGQYVLLTLQEILESDPEFKRAWEENGCDAIWRSVLPSS